MNISWGLQKTGALAPWGAFGKRGAVVKVAVLDTGIDCDHPDVQGNVAAFAEFNDRGEVVPTTAVYDSGTHGTSRSEISGGEGGMRGYIFVCRSP